MHQQKKIINLIKNQKKNYENDKPSLMKHMVYNFSSYVLTEEEMTAFAYRLDHHIPTNINKDAIFTESEQFFQNLLRDISHIPENKLNRIKIKLRNTCEKYCNVRAPCKYRDIVSKLSKREDLVILKQDKGRGVVLMDRHKSSVKCLTLLSTKQFTTLTNDPTKTLESKVQRTLRKIKSKFTEQKYKKLYSTGSCRRKFYCTTKIHKIPVNGNIDDLPIRLITSNINTATYNLANYLTKLLAPLRESEYIIKSTKDFIGKVKAKEVPNSYQMVPFDVKSLFTNVPRDRLTDIVLRRIYDKHELQTSITRSEMKELLILCTKNVHFTFDNVIKVQKDGVAMGSPLGPVLSDIFMIELETSLLPELTYYIRFWKRYVDDTICFIKVGSVNYILSVLNSFDVNIEFTYELEHEGKLPFLDVLLCRKGKNFYATIYRKATNNDIYLNWNAFEPISWKRGTLKTLIERAYLICSTEELRNRDVEHIEKVFYENNSHP